MEWMLRRQEELLATLVEVGGAVASPGDRPQFTVVDDWPGARVVHSGQSNSRINTSWQDIYRLESTGYVRLTDGSVSNVKYLDVTDRGREHATALSSLAVVCD